MLFRIGAGFWRHDFQQRKPADPMFLVKETATNELSECGPRSGFALFDVQVDGWQRF